MFISNHDFTYMCSNVIAYELYCISIQAMPWYMARSW